MAVANDREQGAVRNWRKPISSSGGGGRARSSRPNSCQRFSPIPDIRAEITALGRSYGYQLIRSSRRAANAADRARLRGTENRQGDRNLMPPQRRWRAVRDRGRLRSRSRRGARSRHGGFCDRTARYVAAPPCPWTEAEHSISAIVADDQTAAALDIAIGAPCLVIDRHTWRSARTLTAVRLVYPGKYHKLVARFKGGEGYQCA